MHTKKHSAKAKKKISDGLKKHWSAARGHGRPKAVKASKPSMPTLTKRKGETTKQFQSRRMKAMWSDPKMRKKLLAGREGSASRSAVLKKRWKDPVGRTKLLAGRKGIDTKGLDSKLAMHLIQFCNNLHKTIEQAVMAEVKDLLKNK